MNPSIRPVFIGGCDRSGTTMLGDMLGAAAGAFATPESQFLHEMVPLLHLGAFATREEAADWLAGHFRFATWEMGDAEELVDLMELDDPRATMENILRRYVGTRRGEDADRAGVWVDHTPDNFKHYAVLKRCYPEARFIHIVRDGRDVFQSIRDLDWGPNNAYMGSRHWTERLQQAMSVEVAEGENCLRVRYEDILRNPERELARISAFAGLPYSDDMVEGGGLILPGFTRGQHKLVGRRPDPSRIGQWCNAMNRREIAEFEAYPWTRALLKKLGYPLVTEQPAHVGSVVQILRYLHDFLRYGWNRFRHRDMERKLLHRVVVGEKLPH